MLLKTDPVVLVTGGARRIGEALVRALHAKHFRVVIHCHRSRLQAWELADALQQVRSGSATVVEGDLNDASLLSGLVGQAVQWGGRLDALINNASVFGRDDSGWDRFFNVNARAPFLLSHAAYPHLAKQQGSIVNITDIHAEKPLKGYAVYCQSKAALALQTKALAREFAPRVRVNAVAPGAILWPEHDNQLSDLLKQEIMTKTPLQRHGDPQFIAQAMFMFLENPFVTGQSLKVDGGRSLGA